MRELIASRLELRRDVQGLQSRCLKELGGGDTAIPLRRGVSISPLTGEDKAHTRSRLDTTTFGGMESCDHCVGSGLLRRSYQDGIRCVQSHCGGQSGGTKRGQAGLTPGKGEEGRRVGWEESQSATLSPADSNGPVRGCDGPPRHHGGLLRAPQAPPPS